MHIGKEQVLSIVNTPYQYLARITMNMYMLARTKANMSTTHINTALAEVDKAVMDKVARLHTKKDHCRVRAIIAGGGFDKVDLAKMNEQHDERCDYCGAEQCTLEHILWHCKHASFVQARLEAAEELVEVPFELLNTAVCRGMASAMQCGGAKTFWGQNLPEGCTEAVRKLLRG